MNDTVRKLGDQLSRTWDSLAEGWRELWQRSRNSITRFMPERSSQGSGAGEGFPHWAVLAGEIADTGRDLLVRVEMPGVDRDDCEVTLTPDQLQIVGVKRADRELVDADYYVRERAFGRFSRSVALPVPVDADRAHASFRNGVLTVRAPKLAAGSRRRLEVV